MKIPVRFQYTSNKFAHRNVIFTRFENLVKKKRRKLLPTSLDAHKRNVERKSLLRNIVPIYNIYLPFSIVDREREEKL